MGKLLVSVSLGIILAIPLIYLLELESEGAITLQIFICIAAVALVQKIAYWSGVSKRRAE